MTRSGCDPSLPWEKGPAAFCIGSRSQSLLVIIVVGVGLATATFFSAKDYGTSAFWRLPRHIGYCGREYDDQGTRTGSPRLFTAQNGAVGAKWTFLSWTFGADSIYAAVAPQRTARRHCLHDGALHSVERIEVGDLRLERRSVDRTQPGQLGNQEATAGPPNGQLIESRRAGDHH